jgi:hypothetical protein
VLAALSAASPFQDSVFDFLSQEVVDFCQVSVVGLWEPCYYQARGQVLLDFPAELIHASVHSSLFRADHRLFSSH